MENTFDYNSYGLGQLECYFLTNKTFTESQANKYLNLSKTFNKSDENILKFIKTMYPNLIENN